MRYIVSAGWVTLSESTGTIQNASTVPVELSTAPTANSGITLAPGESRQYEEMPKYVRALSNIGPAVLNVVTFRESGSGGGGDEEFATDAEVDEMLDDVF